MDQLSQVVDEITEHEVYSLARAAADVPAGQPPNAFWHSNGYLTIHLSGKELDIPTDGLRLNCWLEVSSFADAHNHRWSLASKVVIGELVVQVLEPGDQERLRHLLHRSTGPGTYTLDDMGQDPMVISSERRLSRGDVYSHVASEVHRVCAVTAPTFTLMVTGQQTVETTDVFVRELGSARTSLGHRRADRSDILRASTIFAEVAKVGQ